MISRAGVPPHGRGGLLWGALNVFGGFVLPINAFVSAPGTSDGANKVFIGSLTTPLKATDRITKDLARFKSSENRQNKREIVS